MSRLHPNAYPGDAFKPVAADIRFGGSRFDGTDLDPYPYLYGADCDEAALAETLLRDLDPDERGARFVPKVQWRERSLTRVATTVDLTMIGLRTGIELGAIGQDTWLTNCGPDDYPQTRAWAQWLREMAPDASGITWRSKREPSAQVHVLFADRCPPSALSLAPGPLHPDGCDFESDEGFAWLRQHLLDYCVSIRR